MSERMNCNTKYKRNDPNIESNLFNGKLTHYLFVYFLIFFKLINKITTNEYKGIHI